MGRSVTCPRPHPAPAPPAFREFDPTDAHVMMDRTTNRSRGFGFVHFRDKRDMESAISKMHNAELEGRRISVTRAVPQSETAPGTPADALRRGQVMPREHGRVHRGPPPSRYDRGYGGGGGGYGGGYDRGYDRGYGGGGGGYGGGWVGVEL